MPELIDQLDSSSSSSRYEDDNAPPDHVMSISEAEVGLKTSAHTIQLTVQLQGKQLLCLVDSGSTNSFLDSALQSELQGVCF